MKTENFVDVLDGVQLPLENVEYTIERYLLDNGVRLDPETRFLLATVRDCVGRVAGSTRAMLAVHSKTEEPLEEDRAWTN